MLKVIERNLVAQCFHSAAGSQDLFVWLNRFEQLKHGRRRKQCQQPSYQCFTCAVQKGATASCEFVESMKHPVANHHLRCRVGVSSELVIPSGTRQCFVAEDLSPTIEDRLERKKAVVTGIRARRRPRRLHPVSKAIAQPWSLTASSPH